MSACLSPSDCGYASQGWCPRCEPIGPVDLVVTVPLSFGLDTWIAEGDAAGEPWSGEEWHFYLSGVPTTDLFERVYVIYNGKLRGYSPLVRIERTGRGVGGRGGALVRHGDAVAVTISEKITGFRGFRRRWWPREIERPFPDWKTP